MEAIHAKPARAAVVALLEGAGLPWQDVTDGLLVNFFCVGQPEAPQGIVGLEIAPPYALLRSLTVDPRARAAGIGSRLVAYAEEHARGHGVHPIYLLTTTAAPFFATRGYGHADRDGAPPFIRAQPSFRAFARRPRASWSSISRSNTK